MDENTLLAFFISFLFSGLALAGITAIICHHRYKMKIDRIALENGYSQSVLPGSCETVWVKN